MKPLRIKGGRVIDPANRVDEVCDVFVRDGKIVPSPNRPPAPPLPVSAASPRQEA